MLEKILEFGVFLLVGFDCYCICIKLLIFLFDDILCIIVIWFCNLLFIVWWDDVRVRRIKRVGYESIDGVREI